MARILIVDDNPKVCNTIQRFLTSAGFSEVTTAATGKDALEKLRSSPFELALLDLRMPPPNGMEVLKQIRQGGIPTEVVMISGFGTIKEAAEALKLGARDFLEKPLDFDVLLEAVHSIVEKRHPSDYPLAKRLDRYVEAYAAFPDMSLDMLCQHFDISYRSAERLFQQHIGMLFRDRLAHYRVEQAKRLIECTDEPFWKIAELCGFKHQSRFSAVFKRMVGMTPKKYKKMADRRKTVADRRKTELDNAS